MYYFNSFYIHITCNNKIFKVLKLYNIIYMYMYTQYQYSMSFIKLNQLYYLYYR